MNDRSKKLLAAQTLGVDALTARVFTAFEEADIDCVLLKGPVLARWLYEDGMVRSYGDADILVPETRLTDAKAMLATLGLTPFRGIATGRPVHAQRLSGDAGTVDLHHQFTGAHAPAQRFWNLVWKNTEEMTVGGRSVRVPTVSVRALIVALHAIQHGTGFDKSLMDLERALSIADVPVWEEARDLAVTLEATEAFAAGLRLIEPGNALADHLGLPSELPTEMALRREGSPTPALVIDWVVQQPGLTGKLGALGRAIVPPREKLDPAGTGSLVGVYAAHWSRIARTAPQGLRRWYGARKKKDP